MFLVITCRSEIMYSQCVFAYSSEVDNFTHQASHHCVLRYPLVAHELELFHAKCMFILDKYILHMPSKGNV